METILRYTISDGFDSKDYVKEITITSSNEVIITKKGEYDEQGKEMAYLSPEMVKDLANVIKYKLEI